jgi:hypothetical protein
MAQRADQWAMRKLAPLAAALAVLACSSEREPYNVCVAVWLTTPQSEGAFVATEARDGLYFAGLQVDPDCLDQQRAELIALSRELCPAAGPRTVLGLDPYQAALAKRVAERCPVAPTPAR